MTTTYETVEGTNPFENQEQPHEARTMTRTEPDGTVYMMTEIEDGVFVQWSACKGCSKGPATCKCSGGPKAPDYILKWRDERFEKSLRHRKPSERPAWVAKAPTVEELAEEQAVKVPDLDGEPLFKATEEEEIDLQVALDAVKGAKETEEANE